MFSFAADSLKRSAQQIHRQSKSKKTGLVAVLNFTYPRGRMSTGSYLVAERFVTYLVQDGVPVVERWLIHSILEEKKMEESGMMNPATLKELGHVLGVEAVLVGTLTDSSEDSTEVAARLIRVETGEVLAAGKTVTERLWRDLPRLPKGALARSPVPASYFSTGSASEKGRFKLADLEPARKRPVYHPAPVPFFMPSSAHQIQGGPTR